MRNNKFFIIFLSGVLLVSLTGCTNKKNESSEVIRPVKYIVANTEGANGIKVFSGVAQSSDEAVLSFKVDGNITRKFVQVGDYVRKGQTIAVLDSQPYAIQTQASSAELEQARAQLKNAYSTYDRTRSLYVNDSASKSDLDASRAGFEAAKATVSALRSKTNYSRLTQSYTRLVAPTNGYIASLDAEVNENVQAGQSIAKIISDSEMKIKLNLPEDLIYKMKKGSKVSVTFDSIEGKKYAGIISEVGSGSIEALTTYPVFIKLLEKDKKIHSGMSASVALNISSSNTKKNLILVPTSAVTADNTGKFIFVATQYKDDLAKVTKKYVEVGDISTEGIEIKKGIEKGDKVITAGVSKIQDGETVRIKDNVL